jgi:hypothetical protein
MIVKNNCYWDQKLVSKMDEFIELANYDWMLSEPR